MKATLYGLTKNKNDIHVKTQLEKMLAQVSEEGAAVIDGANIAAETIYGKSIVAGSIEATQIKAGAITSDHITANGIVADKIKTGILRSTNGASWLNLNDGTFSYANGNFTFQDGKMVVRAHTIELGGEEVPTKTQTEEYADSLGETLQGQIDTSIKSTEVEYYSSTSSTSPVGGAWSTTAPAWQEGRFMWSRTKITPNKGSIVYKPNETGTNISGATGNSAKIVTVTPSAQLFWRNEENAVTPATITVDGSVQNTTISAWQYSVNGGSFTTTLPTGVTRSGNKVSLTGATVTARTIAVKALDASGNTDTTTIAMVQDGVKGVDGSSGPKGENAIVGILTNESITVPASESGAVSSFAGATGTFEIYDGITRKTGSGVTYSVSGTPSGITVSINATTGVYTISAMTGGTSVLSGNATLQAVYNGVTIQKVLTVTKAMTGKTGATGSTGASGSDAKIVTLTSSAQIFAKNANGAISPSNITVEGVSQNTSITAWEYSVDGGTFSSVLPTGLSRTGNVVSITGASVTAKSLSLRAKDASGVSDVLSIAVVQDGAKGLDGSNGSDGADAYTVVLSNEAHTFAGNTASAIASSVTVNVVAYKGATRVGATIGTISGAVAGMSTSIATNGTTTASFTVSVTTAMSATNGLLTIPITVDGKVFSKTFSFALALKGADGANGSAGADAKVIIVNPSAQIFTKDANGNVTPSTITIDGTAQNVTISAWEYSIDGGVFSTSLPTGLTRSGNKVTITGSSMTAKNISVRASGSGVSDTTTIAMVQDGAKGSDGSTGAKGDNSIVGYLTNESVTLGASSTGVVSSFATASGTFRVFDGITEVTTNAACVFSLNASTGVTLTINSSGVYTVTAMSADTATAEFKAVYKGITITKAMSLSKSRVGATGSQGAKGEDGKGISSAVVDYQNHTNGTTAPTGTWSSTIPTPVKGQYLWTRTITTYTDNSSITTYAVAYNALDGQKGDTGNTGSAGSAGVGVSSTSVHYQLSTNGSTAPTSTWLTAVPAPVKGQYLWTRTVISYTNGTSATAYSTSYYATDGQKGDKGDTGAKGADGISPIVGLLTNESITLPASDAGVVFNLTGATGTFNVYEGTVLKNAEATFSIVTQSNIAVSITQAGVYTISTVAVGASVLSGTATLRAVYGGVTIDKILTVTKALAGTQGTPSITYSWVTSAGMVIDSQGNIRQALGQNGAWTEQAYTKESYTGGAFLSFKAGVVGNNTMFGLNTDPDTDSNYPSLDYAYYMNGTTVGIYESGTSRGSFGTYAVGDTFQIVYDGVNVKYYHAGVLDRTVAAPANLKLHIDSSFYNISAANAVTDIYFGPSGSVGATGSAGQNATTYWINASTNAIKKDVAGAIVPSTITFSGFSKTGTANPVAYAGRFIIQISTDGVSYTTAYTSTANQASYTYTIPTTASFVKARYYLAGGTSTLLDEQTVPVLVDAEGIEIGGRNLILNSRLVPTSPNNTGLGIATLMEDEATPYYRTIGNTAISTFGFDGSATSSRFSEPMIDGATYTVSVDVRAPRTGTVAFYAGIGSQPLSRINEWVRIKHTYTYIGTSYRIIGLTYDSSTIDYRNWKIEKGNIATDWTEAPEDVELAQNKKVYNPVRYIRDWANGSSANTSNHWYEIMANDTNGTNVAQGKTVTTNGTASSLSVVTDGIVNGTYSGTGVGKQYVEIDLGSVYHNIASVSVWHYHPDNRTYYETRTEVSEDGVNWYPLFDSLIEGEYAETAAGQVLPNTKAKSESLISALNTAKQLANTTSKVVINGGNITAGSIKDKNSRNTINLDNGTFTLANGNIVYNGSTLEIKSGVSFSTLDSAAQTKINNGDTAKATLDSKVSTWDTVTSKATPAQAQGYANTAREEAKSHADLVTSIKSLHGNAKKFINPASMSQTVSSVYGYTLIRTPITQSYMTKIKISGYNYVTGKTDINVDIGFYAYSTGILQRSFVSNGDFVIDKVQIGRDSAGQAVIILGHSDTHYSYPTISVDEAILSFGVAPDSYKDGWSISISSDLTGITGITNIEGFDTKTTIDQAQSTATNAKSKTDAWTYPSTTEINGSSIRTGSLSAGKITTGEMHGDRITAGTLKADRLIAGSLTIENLNSDTQTRINNGHSAKATLDSKASLWDAKLTDAQVAAKILSDKAIKDTRATNENPAWYFSNYPNQIVREFKNVSTMTVGTGTYGILTTDVPWSGNSGGSVKQTFRTNTEEFKRDGTTTSWTAWVNHDAMAVGAKTLTDKWAFTGKTTINGGQVETDTITAAQIAANTITATQIASRTITTDRIVANAITANEIASGTITATEIKSRTITTDRIATNAITANEINVANLSALSANLGNVTAGTIKSTNGLIDINLNTGVINLGQPLTINAKPVAIKEDVDGISVGGRNLIANTSEEILTLDGYPASGYSEGVTGKTILAPDKDSYVLSFDAKSTVSGDRIRCHFYNPSTTTGAVTSAGDTSTSSDGNAEVTLTNQWKRYWVKYTQNGAGTTLPKSWIIGRRPAGLGTGNISVKGIKLEEGNKPTDWTPAPEDVEARISDKASNESVNEVASGIEEIRSDLIENYAGVGDVQRLDEALTASNTAIEEARADSIKDINGIDKRTAILEQDFGDYAVDWNFVRTSIRLADEGMRISKAGEKTGLLIQNDKISFVSDDNEVAYITGSELYITQGTFLNNVKIGQHRVSTLESDNTITVIRYEG